MNSTSDVADPYLQESLPPHELWSNDDVIAAYQRGTNDVLAVCFLSFGGQIPEDLIRSQRVRQTSIVNGGVNHALYLTDMTWMCCMRPEIRERVVGYIRRAAEQCGAKKIFAYGNSSGGSAGIYLSTFTGFDAVLATSPQLDLRQASRAFDVRWRNWSRFYEDEFDFPSLGPGFAAGMPIVILHGLRDGDGQHAAMVPGGPHIHQYLFPDLGHELKPRLKPERRLGRVFDCIVNDDMGAIDAIITEAGGIRRGQLDYVPDAFDWDLNPKKRGNGKAGQARKGRRRHSRQEESSND